MMPLTIEQLKQMNGKPVWVEDKIDKWGNSWGVVCVGYGVESVEQFIAVHEGFGRYKRDFITYGETWIAYSANSIHITVDDFVEYWHTHETSNSLRDLLGMTKEEYTDWLKGKKPSHIDREKWTAEWKEYTGADAGFHYCSKCKQQAFNYDDGDGIIEVLSDFCPSCGKAMNDEAWTELKRRLSGDK